MVFLAALHIAASLVALLLSVRPLRFRPRRPLAWAWLYAAVVLAFAGAGVFEWGPASGWELVFDYAGASVMTCAGVVALAGIVSIAKDGKRVLVWVGRVLGVVLVGYLVRVGPRVVSDGWWAVLPSPMLVEVSPWLPRAAINDEFKPAGWNLQSRIDRGELWEWERDRLRTKLERRFRANPTSGTLDDWERLSSRGETGDALAVVLFEKLVGKFLDGTPNEQQDAGHALWDYLPTNWKIIHPHIGASEGVRVTRGRVPRLMELAASEDFILMHTATGLLAVSGDDALAAIPILVGIARREGGTDRFQAVNSLEYLAKTAPMVRARLVTMTEGPDAFERILAIEALSQWNWQNPEVEAHLQHLIQEGDGVVAAYASRYASVHTDADPHRAAFAFLDSGSADRAGYLASVQNTADRLVEFVPRSIAALSDEDPRVREAACDVLNQVAGYPNYADRMELARGPLTGLLDDANPGVVAAARRVLVAMDRKPQ